MHAPRHQGRTGSAPGFAAFDALGPDGTRGPGGTADGAAERGQAPRTTALDPGAVLRAMRCTAFAWDLAADALLLAPGGHALLTGVPAEGLGASEGLGVSAASFAARLSPADAARREAALRAGGSDTSGAGVPYRVEYAIAQPDGRRLSVEETGRWFSGVDGEPVRVEGLIRRLGDAAPGADEAAPAPALAPASAPVGSTKAAPGRAEGEESRHALLAEVEERLSAPEGERRGFGLFVVSIDDLAGLSARRGRDAALAARAAVIERLSGVMRGADRIGPGDGNRILILLSRCSRDDMALAASRFCAALAEPLPLDGAAETLRIRIGGALGPAGARGAGDLLHRAELALADAKSRPPGAFVPYTERLALRRSRDAEARLVDLVVDALNGRRVLLARQPVVDARTRRPVFSEALMRLQRPDGTIAAASQIVPEAERLGLAELIDTRVLHLALEAMRAEPELVLSLNVSTASLGDEGWLAALTAGSLAHPGLAKRLIVEITETSAIADLEAVTRATRAIKALGARVAIDDFGAGHTSFRTLRALAVDILKIDGVFVQNLSRSADDRFFVRTLLSLARELGVPTVAEWVEDADTAELLAGWGCDLLQGDFLGPAALPAPGPALADDAPPVFRASA